MVVMEPDTFNFKKPLPADGKKMWELVKNSKTLDLNSLYHYIIMSKHFGNSSVAAYTGDDLAGFVTSYFPPDQKDTIFVWQVCVSKKYQGQGLGKKMLIHLVKANYSGLKVKYLDATITPSNSASIALFTSVAKELGADFSFNNEIFPKDFFGGSGHEPEILFHIGPID